MLMTINRLLPSWLIPWENTCAAQEEVEWTIQAKKHEKYEIG